MLYYQEDQTEVIPLRHYKNVFWIICFIGDKIEVLTDPKWYEGKKKILKDDQIENIVELDHLEGAGDRFVIDVGIGHVVTTSDRIEVSVKPPSEIKIFTTGKEILILDESEWDRAKDWYRSYPLSNSK